MANIDQNYDGSTRLRNWYPKVKNNFSAINTQLEGHINNHNNPHSVTKAQVGLSNVDNTSDTSKPISTAMQTALDDKANKSDITALENNTSLIQNDDGGFSAGENADATTGSATGRGAWTTTGGAAGYLANAEEGGAVGAGARATSGGATGKGAFTINGGASGQMAQSSNGGAAGDQAIAGNGGAVGQYAMAGNGFAGGYNAQAVSGSQQIDAIQLGTGTNSTPKTLQVYSYQLLDEEGKIPDARLNDGGRFIRYLWPSAPEPGVDATDLDNRPNGIDLVEWYDSPGVGGYMVVTIRDDYKYGVQYKISTDGVSYRNSGGGTWGAWIKIG